MRRAAEFQGSRAECASCPRALQGGRWGGRSIEFVDLKKRYRKLKPSIDGRSRGFWSIASSFWGLKSKSWRKHGAAHRSRHCMSCASGTDAILIALMALGIGPGDEVIPAFTFIATGEMIGLLRAPPVFVDIDAKPTISTLSCWEGDHTAYKSHHAGCALYGQCAKIDEINAIAARRNLPVIEDGAQSSARATKGARHVTSPPLDAPAFSPPSRLPATETAAPALRMTRPWRKACFRSAATGRIVDTIIRRSA